MTPEQIEYVREWAASGNEPRFAVDIEDFLPEELWQMLDKDEDSLCELSPLGIGIAAQAERMRELWRTATELEIKCHGSNEHAKLELPAPELGALAKLYDVHGIPMPAQDVVIDVIQLYERLHRRAQQYNTGGTAARELQMIVVALRYMLAAYPQTDSAQDARFRDLEAENADLRSAFRQACAIAQECQLYVLEVMRAEMEGGNQKDSALETMRANLERLLK